MNPLSTLLKQRGISIRGAARALALNESTVRFGLKQPLSWQVILLLSVLAEMSAQERDELLQSLFLQVLEDVSEED